MRRELDLRLVIPPFISLIHGFLVSPDNSLSEYVSRGTGTFSEAAYLFSFLLLIFVLCVSVKLTIRMDRVRLRVGDFSFLSALSLLISFFRPPSFVSVIFPVLALASPCNQMLWDLLVSFWGWIFHILQAFRVAETNSLTQSHEGAEPQSPEVEIDLTEIVTM